MARRRRAGSRTSVVDGLAEIVIPIEAIEAADGEPMRFSGIKRWMKRVDTYPASLSEAYSVSVVLDRFAYDFHLADVAHESDTHDGDEFLDAARTSGSVNMYVVDGIDPRRSKPADLDAAAKAGSVLGGRVEAFPVDQLSD